jgi:hypothetical protein
MKAIKALIFLPALLSASSWGISRELTYRLCADVVHLDFSLALQSLQAEGDDAPGYRDNMKIFRLTDEQVAPIIERYKKRPGDARLVVQHPPRADSYYLDNCVADPVRYIPNYENLKAIYK